VPPPVPLVPPVLPVLPVLPEPLVPPLDDPLGSGLTVLEPLDW